MIGYSEDKQKQQNTFVDCRIKYFGGFDGNPRKAVVMPVNETAADFAHVILPAVQFNVRELGCIQFIRIMGKC